MKRTDLDDPDRLLDLDAVLCFLCDAAALSGDDHFGLHLGRDWDPAGLGVLNHAIRNAPTVGTGLRNLDRYGRVHLQGGRIALEDDGDEARLCYRLEDADPELARQHVESAAIAGLRIVQSLAGEEWRPARVTFAHRRPRDVSEHERVFGCPLEFEVPGAHLALCFPRALLEQPVPAGDGRLLPLVERHLEELLAQHAQDEWMARVRDTLARSLCDGNPTIRGIAPRLGMSVRTLQRRLDERNVVWKSLVAELRQELAHRYLASGETSLTEIAFLLGYSDLSAFHRAFRRWTGATPLSVRRRLRAS